MVYLKKNYNFLRFQRGSNIFQGGGGGGPTFSRGGVQMLISIETYRSCDFTAGSGPRIPPSGFVHVL